MMKLISNRLTYASSYGRRNALYFVINVGKICQEWRLEEASKIIVQEAEGEKKASLLQVHELQSQCLVLLQKYPANC